MKKLLLLLIFLAAYTAQAQTFSVSEINTSEFPRVKAAITVTDYFGNPIEDLTVDDFVVHEDGVNMEPTLALNCADSITSPEVSIVLVLDQSTSMRDDAGNGERYWDWVKQGASSFINSIDYTGRTKVAMISFGAYALMRCYFTDNKQQLLDSLNAIDPDGATRYDPPFLDPNIGAVALLNTRPTDMRRIVVFLTDGNPNQNPQTVEIIEKLQTSNIQTYCITIMIDMNEHLKEISRQTGGDSFEVKTKNELNSIYEQIAFDAQKKKFCELSWETDYYCEEDRRTRQVKFEFVRYDLRKVRERPYIAPPQSMPYVEPNGETIFFDTPNVNESTQKEITLKAKHQPFNVNGATISPDAFYEIIDWGGQAPPFRLDIDEERTITVKFTQGNEKDRREATLKINGNKCPPEIELVGGVVDIVIENPIDGELYSTCDSVEIRWSGLPSKQKVTLLYSTDNGLSWEVITESATGFMHKWLPPVESQQYKIKAHITPEIIWAMGSSGSMENTAAGIAIDNSMNTYAVGNYYGTIEFDETSFNTAGDRDMFLAKYNLAGDEVFVNSMGGLDADSTCGIVISENNELFIGGTTYQTAKFGDQMPKMDIHDRPYGFVAKYRTNGFCEKVAVIGPFASHLYENFKVYTENIAYHEGFIFLKGQYEGYYTYGSHTLPDVDTPTDFTVIYDDDLNIIDLHQGHVDTISYSQKTVWDYDNKPYKIKTYTDKFIVNQTDTLFSAGKTDIVIFKSQALSDGESDSTGSFTAISPMLEFSDIEIDFQQCAISYSLEKTVNAILCNNSEMDSEIESYNISGTEKDNFSITTDLSGITIAQGECIPITIEFTPMKNGKNYATLEIYGTCGEYAEINLEGTGTCKYEIMPKFDFYTVDLGSSVDEPINCLIENKNETPMIINPTIIGEDASDFSLYVSGPVEIPAGQCFSARVTFIPSDASIRNAEIDYGIPDVCDSETTKLTGEGLLIGLSFKPMDWGRRLVGSVNDTVLLVMNTGNSKINIDEIKLRGDGEGAFEFIIPVDQLPTSIAANSPIPIPIQFLPPDVGMFTDYVELYHSGNQEPVSIKLTGEGYKIGLEAFIECSTAVWVNSYEERNFVIHNTSLTDDLHIYDLSITDNNQEYSFKQGQTTTDIIIGPNQTEEITIIFSPIAEGFRHGEMTISSNAGMGNEVVPSEETINMDCEALDVNVEQNHDFGNVLICSEESFQLEISNSSPEWNIEIDSYELQNNDDGVFSVILPANPIIEPLNTAIVEVLFFPEKTITYNSTLIIQFTNGKKITTELTGSGIQLELYSDEEIETSPSEYLIYEVRGRMKEVDNDIDYLVVQVEYDRFSLDFRDDYFVQQQIYGWQWDNPQIINPGVIEITGSGLIGTPFETPFFKLRFLSYLSEDEKTSINLRPVHDLCQTRFEKATDIIQTGVCVLDMRHVTISSTDYSISNPQPNPASSSFNITFGVGIEAKTRIVIHNAIGNIEEIVTDDILKPGTYETTIDASKLPSGVYFIKISSGPYQDIRQLIITK